MFVFFIFIDFGIYVLLKSVFIINVINDYELFCFFYVLEIKGLILV